MSAFMQQLPALTGVVIGVLGSCLAIARGDRARFRREQTARWEERRLSVYADYARCLERTVTLVMEMEMERFGRERTRAPGAWQALLERRRGARDGYYAAVREDLALSADRPVAWQVPPLRVRADVEQPRTGAAEGPGWPGRGGVSGRSR